MAGFPTSARVVIIGGGVVGVSALYHLARAGWSDCVLLEKNELTAGSTWHAAGNVPTFSGDWALMNMQRYSAELYRRLGAEVDYPMNYHVTGSVRLGHSADRLEEFRRVVGMGRRQGMGMEILSPGDLKGRYPFVETGGLTGALYDPNDGDIDPAQLTQALAKGARAAGARIERFCPATGVRREGEDWVVETQKGEIRCEIVVNAAGYYAAEVARWFGRRLPMVVMSHQYLLFDTVPELESWSREVGHKLPLLRDVDDSYYLRQEKYGFNLGPYESACKAHWITPEDPFPQDFSFQLFPDDLDRLEPQIAAAMGRVPLLEQAALTRVINGPIPYTPDGNPLIGPMPGVPNAYEACVFTFGICQGGGAGKALAEWITEGRTEWDMWSCDPRRFTGFEEPDYAIAKGKEIYGNEYAIHYPHHVWPAARDRKCSPLHEALKARGAQFGPFNGWERALWFARPGDDTSEAAQRTWRRDGPWEGAVAEEARAVRDHAGVLDLPGFSRFRLSGAGAAEWLARQITGRVPQPGRLGLGYFADETGGIVTEMSMACLAPDTFWLITAATAQSHDRDWLMKHLEPGLELRDETADWTTLILTGPKARDLLAPLSDADLSLPWLSLQEAQVAGRPVQLIRVSFAGELGWELHARPEDAPALWDALVAAGVRPFGMFALDSLRIEKGYRGWKTDLSTEYSVLQAGLGRFVDFSKPVFRGREALLAEVDAPRARQFAALALEGPAVDVPALSTLWQGDTIVGEVTSSAWGYRLGHCLALGMLDRALCAPGTVLEVEVFDRRYPARVLAEAELWDSSNARLRA
ncbi:FAD-dependent oxidoreductase [Pseudooceanicola sp. CBS1P-1]|uniref:FAD-dependent oxidoreductase n=1 Tax=Pseudooceanicola albus TaxID=2692189 RepID=A0A6L7G924_9RHOB|nr:MULTISPECIES: FAD-dependent oxidoreductase [Pseudooceanicola]MBT9383005.1 FAD-dependent oxidoreductase [Pseudooceanicola endophyticus]MXN19193.1 FAD-dependent oxidoreductase [Pseudooceanicola albus]